MSIDINDQSTEARDAASERPESCVRRRYEPPRITEFGGPMVSFGSGLTVGCSRPVHPPK
jgi:hypothetical protein